MPCCSTRESSCSGPTGRALNVLTLQDRSAVAAALGDPSPEVLMGRIAEAARAIAWMSDDTWRRVRSGLAGADPAAALGRSATARRRSWPSATARSSSRSTAGPATTRCSCYVSAPRPAAVTCRSNGSRSIALAQVPIALPVAVAADARDLFQDLLLAGRPTIGVVEALDHHGLWEQLVPEWTAVRSRPQHNPYHRFTVDRHLLETIANASELASGGRAAGAAGARCAAPRPGQDRRPRPHRGQASSWSSTVGARIGCTAEEIDVLRGLVRNHLLLSDVASRRDLDDEATIDLVAKAVGSVESLHLLAALTEADAKATGPTAWSPWKAELVSVLVARVDARLRGEPQPVMSKPS